MNKYYMTWSEMELLCEKLIKKVKLKNIKSIYGVPRGGLIPAVYLSHLTNIPLVTKIGHPFECLVVDDICDKGVTLDKYLNNGYTCAVLTNKFAHENLVSAKEVNQWIVFPWETEESSKADYIENGKNNN